MKTRLLSWITLTCLAAPAPAQTWTWGDLLNPARTNMGAGSADGKAFFAGGGHPFVGYDDTISIYDSALGHPTDPATWSTATLSQARANLAVTSVGGKILFAGGNHQGFDLPVSDVVDVYDVGNDSWSVEYLSEPRTADTATSVGGYALFAGGEPHPFGQPGPPSDRIDVYEAATGTWSQATLAVPRLSIRATSVGPYALLAGGTLFTAGGVSDVVEVYDSTIGPPADPAAWSIVHLSQARWVGAATTAGGKAFFAGGVAETMPGFFEDVATVDVYDSSVGPPSEPAAWSVEQLSVARNYLSATSQGGEALFAGGTEVGDFGNVSVDVVDVFDTATDAWSVEALSAGRLAAATTVDGYALFAGGHDEQGWVFSPYSRVDAREVAAIGEDYCGPANLNSSGEPGLIQAFGSELVPANDLQLTASQLPEDQFGYFLTSLTQGFVANPGGSQGNLCLGGQIGRFVAQIQNSGELGSFSIQVDLTDLPAPINAPVLPGETWNFTAWYRDKNPDPTSNFTNAVSVLFQ